MPQYRAPCRKADQRLHWSSSAKINCHQLLFVRRLIVIELTMMLFCSPSEINAKPEQMMVKIPDNFSLRDCSTTAESSVVSTYPLSVEVECLILSSESCEAE